jgi:hypothetical protein
VENLPLHDSPYAYYHQQKVYFSQKQVGSKRCCINFPTGKQRQGALAGKIFCTPRF